MIWTAYCQNAIGFLQVVMPFMVVKCEQAAIAIKLHESLTIASPDRRAVVCERLKQRMHALNRPGATPPSAIF